MKARPSPWAPRILLVGAALVSVWVLLRGLKTTTASYDAVETRGVELRRLPSASEQLDIDEAAQVSSLDLLPKVPLREADPLEPEPDPPPAPAAPPPAPAPPSAPPAETARAEKEPFYRPQLQRRGLPKERTSNASSGAFLKAAPEAPATGGRTAPAASSERSSRPDRPRMFRDTNGKATIRN